MKKQYYFGSHATGKWVDDRHIVDNYLYSYKNDYDILVITISGDKNTDSSIENPLKEHDLIAAGGADVNVISHDIDYINQMLKQGHYFFSDIIQEGILLYDAGNFLLAQPMLLAPHDAKSIAQEEFDNWFVEG